MTQTPDTPEALAGLHAGEAGRLVYDLEQFPTHHLAATWVDGAASAWTPLVKARGMLVHVYRGMDRLVMELRVPGDTGHRVNNRPTFQPDEGLPQLGNAASMKWLRGEVKGITTTRRLAGLPCLVIVDSDAFDESRPAREALAALAGELSVAVAVLSPSAGYEPWIVPDFGEPEPLDTPPQQPPEREPWLLEDQWQSSAAKAERLQAVPNTEVRS